MTKKEIDKITNKYNKELDNLSKAAIFLAESGNTKEAQKRLEAALETYKPAEKALLSITSS